MLINVISDLHNEFEELDFNPPKCDVAVIAGDLDIRIKGITWINKKYPTTPVIYVPGNHEYYRGSIEKIDELLKEHVLQNSVRVFEKEKVVFIGATLWTDYDLYGNPYAGKVAARTYMNDFKLIEDFTPDKAHKLFDTSVKFIEHNVAWFSGHRPAYKVVIVTHHLPSVKCIGEEYRAGSDPTNSSFASNLDYIFYKYKPTLWICGHSHGSCDITIDETRVVMNSRGYPHALNKNFKDDLVIEI